MIQRVVAKQHEIGPRMCRHRYTADYKSAPGSMGQRCPYPAYYEGLRARAGEARVAGPMALPIDREGVCLFHSTEIDWKRTNGFQQRFLELVEILNADDGQKNYDFAEFVFVGGGEGILRIANVTFRRSALFTAAVFPDSLVVEHADFQGGIVLDYARFHRDLKILDSKIGGLDCSHASFAGLAFFSRVEFLHYALFDDVRFSGTTGGVVVKFEQSRFHGITSFSGAVFTLGAESSTVFWDSRFDDFANFQNTRFQCHVAFEDVVFGFVTEFVDTSFDSIGSSARFRGSAVELKRIEVPVDALLTFKSTNPRDKMFHHDVQISFKEDPAGTIRFDNVDFSKIATSSRLLLTRLSKLGRVEIGAGCIKYRHQTGIRSISVSQSNASLVIELCQTFTNYFTQSNGLNLGFEIVDRDESRISFFYFSDEDISEETFLERLAQTERGLWNLLSARTDRQLPILGEAAGMLSTGKEDVVINAVDGISALLGTFFRVGARIALGVWKAADTRALLNAIRFNDEGAEDRASSLQRVLVEKYSGQTLFGINSQQNNLLLPMVAEGSAKLASGKVRILFLGANSLDEPLDLERDVRNIRTSLRLASERDNLEFHQEWAVTVDTLTQAMLENSPTIVHFSGHGLESGIILREGQTESKVVSADALANLFRLFSDTVRCVVLSSCYSEHQARAIRLHIPYVIGMNEKIPDDAAIAFATGFYQAIGAGREIPFAFELGVAKIGLEGVSGMSIPVLL